MQQPQQNQQSQTKEASVKLWNLVFPALAKYAADMTDSAKVPRKEFALPGSTPKRMSHSMHEQPSGRIRPPTKLWPRPSRSYRLP